MLRNISFDRGGGGGVEQRRPHPPGRPTSAAKNARNKEKFAQARGAAHQLSNRVKLNANRIVAEHRGRQVAAGVGMACEVVAAATMGMSAMALAPSVARDGVKISASQQKITEAKGDERDAAKIVDPIADLSDLDSITSADAMAVEKLHKENRQLEDTVASLQAELKKRKAQGTGVNGARSLHEIRLLENKLAKAEESAKTAAERLKAELEAAKANDAKRVRAEEDARQADKARVYAEEIAKAKEARTKELEAELARARAELKKLNQAQEAREGADKKAKAEVTEKEAEIKKAAEAAADDEKEKAKVKGNRSSPRWRDMRPSQPPKVLGRTQIQLQPFKIRGIRFRDKVITYENVKHYYSEIQKVFVVVGERDRFIWDIFNIENKPTGLFPNFLKRMRKNEVVSIPEKQDLLTSLNHLVYNFAVAYYDIENRLGKSCFEDVEAVTTCLKYMEYITAFFDTNKTTLEKIMVQESQQR